MVFLTGWLAMSAPMIIDPMVISAPETQSAAASILVAETELEFAVCDCCGLTVLCAPQPI